MNEFVVWDETGYMGEDDKVFFTLKELKDEGFHFHLDENGNTVIFELVDNDMGSSQSFLKHKTFTYIGKIDINSKQIYADCSIVEIGFSWQKKEDLLVGFFEYDKASLCYVIYDIKNKEYLDFDLTKMQYFKIIDTIQENKLRLISEAKEDE